MQGFCPYCDDITEIEKNTMTEEYPVKNDILTITAKVFKCSACGNDFLTSDLEQENYEAAVTQYRQKHGLLFPEEIVQLRKKYELSQRQLARILRWGESTICIYEKGKIQDAAHNDLLKLLHSPGVMAKLISENREALSETEVSHLKSRLQALMVEEHKSEERKRMNSLYEGFATEFTGNQKFDIGKFTETVLIFLNNGGPTYKTKLLKLLFYADFLFFKSFDKSITGTVYTKLPFGPVPEDYITLVTFLSKNKYVEIEVVEFPNGQEGERLKLLEIPSMKRHAPDEVDVIHHVWETFKDYTAGQLSEYSHKETAYLRTQDNMPISYRFSDRLSIAQ